MFPIFYYDSFLCHDFHLIKLTDNFIYLRHFCKTFNRFNAAHFKNTRGTSLWHWGILNENHCLIQWVQYTLQNISNNILVFYIPNLFYILNFIILHNFNKIILYADFT